MEKAADHFDILLIRRKSGACDALCYGSADAIWMARFDGVEAMAEKLEGLSDSADYRVREFAEKTIYPDHVAGAINDISVSEAELKSAGFVSYRQSS